MSNVWVKVCGLTRPDDVESAIRAGADAVGLVLVDRSPRRIDPQRASELATIAKGRATVVLLVEYAPGEALEAVARVGADAVQPYGPDAGAIAAEAVAAGIEVLLPTPVAAGQEPDLTALVPGARPLLETSLNGEMGGTGVAFDWVQARDVPGAVIAGGLAPDNVAAAIRAALPWGVDASSGLEAEVGRKDDGKVTAFVAAAKAAAASD